MHNTQMFSVALQSLPEAALGTAGVALELVGAIICVRATGTVASTRIKHAAGTQVRIVRV